MAARFSCSVAIMDGATSIYPKAAKARHLYSHVQYHYQNIYEFRHYLHTISPWLLDLFLYARPKSGTI